MSWHDFEHGGEYDRDQVVDVCERHIRSARLANPSLASACVEEIRASKHRCIVFRPFGSSWGASPMNPNAWRTTSGDLIWEPHRIPTG